MENYNQAKLVHSWHLDGVLTNMQMASPMFLTAKQRRSEDLRPK